MRTGDPNVWVYDKSQDLCCLWWLLVHNIGCSRENLKLLPVYFIIALKRISRQKKVLFLSLTLRIDESRIAIIIITNVMLHTVMNVAEVPYASMRSGYMASSRSALNKEGIPWHGDLLSDRYSRRLGRPEHMSWRTSMGTVRKKNRNLS